VYGIYNNYTDVTAIVANLADDNKTVRIPKGDVERSQLFGDPLLGVLKHIRVTLNGSTRIYADDESFILNLETVDIASIISSTPNMFPVVQIKEQLKDVADPVQKLELIHTTLKFAGGNIRDEYPEQLLAVKYIPSTAKVLEIGSNIGRNTLTIASLLDDDKQLVTLECDPNSCAALHINRRLNGMKFGIEDAALSYRKLIQKGWNTIPSDTVLPGYKEVKTMTFHDIEAKNQITFDTIVADCEGALYWILLDYPDLFKNINLLIQENDYMDLNQKRTVDAIAHLSGLRRIYSEAGPWGPCAEFFYEVLARL